MSFAEESRIVAKITLGIGELDSLRTAGELTPLLFAEQMADVLYLVRDLILLNPQSAASFVRSFASGMVEASKAAPR